MARPHIAYSVSFGLAGCYMPDSISGPVRISTRRELADLIRGELESYDLPSSLFREVRIRRLWGLICYAGSASSYGFSLQHGANALTFHGLTRAEEEEQDCED